MRLVGKLVGFYGKSTLELFYTENFKKILISLLMGRNRFGSWKGSIIICPISVFAEGLNIKE